MIGTWFFSAVLAAVVLLALLVLWLAVMLRRYSKQLVAIQKRAEALAQVSRDLAQTREQQANDIRELRTGALGAGRRLGVIEDRLNAQQETLEAVQNQDPDARLYSRAMRMVELGANIDEVIAECELPRAEAELLYSLHRER